DDPVGATSVHLVCGVFGTLAVGIFNKDAGLITGQFQLFINQIIGIVAVGAFTLIVSGIVWTILKATLGIRVTPEEEMEGLDVGEHGMEAYSGFVKESDIVTGGHYASSVDMETPSSR
ncbi:MAG: ammonium transporter, partial [Microcystis sp. LE19-196.1B]|nr:ammonium transporter [Microcystis sp. LE19-196.1B]